MNIIHLKEIDIVYNMNDMPCPFEDNTYEEIVLDDLLEHSNNFLEILEEIYRVCKDSYKIKMSVPHYSSDIMYTDPTHTTFFSSRSFNYFVRHLRFI